MGIELLIDGGGIVTENFGPGGAYQPCPGSSNPGLDIAAACGRWTHAIGYGTVLSVGNPCWAGPNAVIIRSGNVDILYAHQSDHAVNPGDQVVPGSHVGAIGSMTGDGYPPCYVGYHRSACGGTATGPHIHWQVAPAGTDFSASYCVGLNPWPYLESWPGVAPGPPPPPPPPPPVYYPPPGGDGSGNLAGLLAIALGAGLVYYGIRRDPDVYKKLVVLR